MPTGSGPLVIASRMSWRCAAAASGVVACTIRATLGERVEVREGAGGGVQALPQQRQRLDGAGDVRVDAQAGQQAGDLLGVVQAVAGGALVRLPAGAVLGRRWVCRRS